MKKTFTLFWLTGKSELVQGETIAQAMTLAGYRNGALGALDFYAEGDEQANYAWDAGARSWESINHLV